MSTLTSKHPDDSDYEKVLPFGSDHALRDEWINPFNDLRIGKLFEELDMTAGITSYKHADGFERDLTIVTAACDRIDLLGALPSDRDLRLRGRVNWVGRSSMEVGIRIESRVGETFHLVARAYFIMVARQGIKAAQVNPLIVQTEEESRRFEQAQQRQTNRKRIAQSFYLNQPPSEAEIQRLHQIFLDIKDGSLQGTPMQETNRRQTLMMYPQNRNIHHKIFGGYLMRLSFELAWNTAFVHCKQRPLFVCVDHMTFMQPVEIGSVVSLSALVIHTGSTSFVVQVDIEVIHPMQNSTTLTNTSYFTFVAVDDKKNPQPVPKVLPITYEEGLKFLDGAKRYALGKQVRKEHEE